MVPTLLKVGPMKPLQGIHPGRVVEGAPRVIEDFPPLIDKKQGGGQACSIVPYCICGRDYDIKCEGIVYV
jgi:hypothetical protein